MTEAQELIFNFMQVPATGEWNIVNHDRTNLIVDYIKNRRSPNVEQSEYLLIYEASHTESDDTLAQKSIDTNSIIRVDIRTNNIAAQKSIRDEFRRIINKFNTNPGSGFCEMHIRNKIDKSNGRKFLEWWIYEVEVIKRAEDISSL